MPPPTRPSAAMSHRWHGLGLNQGPDGCRFTPARWCSAKSADSAEADAGKTHPPRLCCSSGKERATQNTSGEWEENQSPDMTARWFVRQIFDVSFPVIFGQCGLNNLYEFLPHSLTIFMFYVNPQLTM